MSLEMRLTFLQEAVPCLQQLHRHGAYRRVPQQLVACDAVKSADSSYVFTGRPSQYIDVQRFGPIAASLGCKKKHGCKLPWLYLGWCL